MSIKRGNKGPEVTLLQGVLYTLRYDITNVDGAFGQETEEAVQAFQEDNDLQIDGIVGDDTASALISALFEADAEDDFDEDLQS